MDKPIKIIWKYKNKHHKYQYAICIFVGNLIPDNIKKILNKIKDLSLFDTFISLSHNEYNTIEKIYGEFWYRHFFNSEHISFTIDDIKSSKNKQNDIIEKMKDLWYNKHISSFEFIDRTYQNFANIFKYNNSSQKKKSTYNDEDNYIYRTRDIVGGELADDSDISDHEQNINHFIVNNIEPSNNVHLIGGSDEDETDEESDNEDESGEEDKDKDKEKEESSSSSDEEINIDYNEDVSNIDLLELDTDVKTTTKEIQKGVSSEEYKNYVKMSEFEINNDTYNAILSNVYTKIYIYNQYIYFDDTIDKIKQKIMCGIKFDPSYSFKYPYLLPNRIYLWSNYEQYKYNGSKKIISKESIMLGQIWAIGNNILSIDIEPSDDLKIYGRLNGNLKKLYDNILKYGSHIRQKIEDTNILSDYSEYIKNNEIYMLDIYHELGQECSFTEEEIKNIYVVYCKIYYGMSYDDFKQIIDFLNNKYVSIENNKILQTYDTIKNQLILENDVMNIISKLKNEPDLYTDILKDNYVIQTTIHLNLLHYNVYKQPKLDLYRIFTNFVQSDKYPFIQYKLLDGTRVHKVYTNNIVNDTKLIMKKWLEYEPIGISFKIKFKDEDVKENDTSNKYISITINENGQAEYKCTWKEESKATLNDIYTTYNYINDLINKINSENDKLHIDIPAINDYKYAFINTISRITLPNNFTINHNDLSDFSRNFFPYISTVINPKKRISFLKVRNFDKSKSGSYFRYKRISKYDSDIKIERRIMYFLKNYEYIEKDLALEISSQFNITVKQALEKIHAVRSKYPNLIKYRKILKKFDAANIIKFKSPGINIDIQGKTSDNYKLRISGARNKEQLFNIISFVNILLYLYSEIYHSKNKDYTYLKDKLAFLTNIAKRMHKVDDVIVNNTVSSNNIKQTVALDVERLGKNAMSDHQYSRDCQNSGNNKRQPKLYDEDNIEEMTNNGYVLNETSGNYEKKVHIREKGKTKEYILKATKLLKNDGSAIYYTCNPEINKKNMFVGFLSNSRNFDGLCRACCFKKNH